MSSLRWPLFLLVLCSWLAFSTLAAPAEAQTGAVTGVAIDAERAHAVESAQVHLPGLNLGALTNQQGRFLLLDVPAGTHEVRVELIGYAPVTREVRVAPGRTTTVDFHLVQTALRLQELVVTGVARETPRVKLSFSVEKLDFEEMPVPASSAEGLLKGKVQGAKVMSGSGQPGEAASVMLRGPTSITGSQGPLIIVDGVITDNTMADVDALDVESIELVRGPAAASLYGSRAQAGVIQITTRRGRSLRVDQSRLVVRNEVGKQDLVGSFELSASHPYKMDEAQTGFVPGDPACEEVVPVERIFECGTVLDGETEETAFRDNPFPGPLYDQMERFFDPGEQLSNYVAAEGRHGTMNYRASFTNLLEEGVMRFNEGYRRKNFRLNLDHGVGSDLELAFSLYYAQSEQDDPVEGWFGLHQTHPAADLLRVDPSTGRLVLFANPLNPRQQNPLYRVRYLSDVDNRQRFMGSLFGRYSPASWFDLEANFSLDRSGFDGTNVVPESAIQDGLDQQSGMTREADVSNDVNASLTAALTHSFGDLTTRTKLRYLVEDQHSEGFHARGRQFAVADVPVLQTTVGAKTVSSYVRDIVSEGYFLISALDYQGKYIGDFLVRRDGSSLFGEDERWHTYYRASGAWRLSQEGWWPFDAIDEFKLRYSLGTAGGRPRFDAQYETYAVSHGVIAPVTLGNEALKPEFATEQELGLDIVLFDRLSAGLTYATSTVEDQLLQVPLPAWAGYESQWRNAGELESNTWEAYLEGSVLESADRSLSFRLNFDRTRQMITDLRVPPYRLFRTYVREGEALGTFYGTRWARSCDDLPSMAVPCSEFDVNDDGYLVWVGKGNSWRDGLNPDGSVNFWGTRGPDGLKWGIPIKVLNEEGLPFLRLGSMTPDFNLSLSSDFRWKGFGVYALVDSEQGTEVYNHSRQRLVGRVDEAGKPNAEKKPIHYYSTLYDGSATSGAFVEDGSYVKLREVALRYTLDRDALESFPGGLGLQQATLSLIGRNIKTWTDYSGFDPEVGRGFGGFGLDSDILGRMDAFTYPNFRSVTVALHLIF